MTAIEAVVFLLAYLCVVATMIFLHLAGTLTNGDKLMALGQEILDAITAQTTIIDGIEALIRDWVDGNLITDEQATAIRARLAENKTKLETALAAGTTAPPVDPPPTT